MEIRLCDKCGGKKTILILTTFPNVRWPDTYGEGIDEAICPDCNGTGLQASYCPSCGCRFVLEIAPDAP